MKAKRKLAMEQCAEKRVELHLHTNMSALDGVSDTKALIERCDWGWRAMKYRPWLCTGIPARPCTLLTARRTHSRRFYMVSRRIMSMMPLRFLWCVVRADGSLEGDFIVLDLEQTELDPRPRKLPKLHSDGEIGSLSNYVNPHKPIPPEITELTVLRWIRCEMHRDFAIQITVLDRQSGAGSQSGFDMSFLKAACSELSIERGLYVY